MSSEITTAFVQQYSANVQMLSQQMGSRLRDTVRIENIVGKNAVVISDDILCLLSSHGLSYTNFDALPLRTLLGF